MSRVVITGLGVIAPNAHGLVDFEKALREGRSGVRFFPHLKELKFGCQVAGVPTESPETLAQRYFTQEVSISMKSTCILYGSIAAVDCWKDAGLFPLSENETDWDTGVIFGTGVGAVDYMCSYVSPIIDQGNARRLGSTVVEQVMTSGVSARIGGILGLGGHTTTNSSACTTGTEAIVEGFHHIRNGRLKRMLVGGAESGTHYTWGCFDSMRVLATQFNEIPEKASRPLSKTASGFVPGSGSGALLLESLESATARGAKIYAEILAGSVNSGGQRGKGSMTAPNPEGVSRCISQTIRSAAIDPKQIDLINGHLTGTIADPLEVNNWLKTLELSPPEMPWIQSTKSMIGHALGAAGAIEAIASVLQLHSGFIHPSLNCEDIHPELEQLENRIPRISFEREIQIVAKASFGFGDVNGCLIFKKWN